MSETEPAKEKKTESILQKTWQEISQPFIDLVHARVRCGE